METRARSAWTFAPSTLLVPLLLLACSCGGGAQPGNSGAGGGSRAGSGGARVGGAGGNGNGGTGGATGGNGSGGDGAGTGGANAGTGGMPAPDGGNTDGPRGTPADAATDVSDTRRSDAASDAPAVNPGAPALTIFSIGDSTMADFDPATVPIQRGWCQEFPQFIVGEDTRFVNAAKSGLSSKTFALEGYWAAVKALIRPGDYVFIQFAHNDETDLGIEGASGRGTAPFGAFQTYLTTYVNESRALGAIPILITPLVRLFFSGTTITPTGQHNLTGNGVVVGNGDYVAAMKEVATLNNVPVIDMTASTKALVEQFGPVDAKALLYLQTDNTHLTGLGATMFAGLVAREMIAKNILRARLNPAMDLIASPSTLRFGDRYLGTTLDQTAVFTGMALAAGNGNVTVTAPAGFLASATPAGPFAAQVQFPYTGGRLSPTEVVVRFQPAAVRAYAGQLTVSAPGATTRSIALSGNALTAPTGVAASVVYALTADTTCTAPANLASCTPERFSNTYARDYLAVGTFAPIQRISLLNPAAPDSWPLEIRANPARYVEFAVSPAAGRSMVIDTVSLFAGAAGGSGMGFRISSSKQGDFGTSIDLGNFPINVSNVVNLITLSLIIPLAAGETLYLRVYPWYNTVATAKFLGLQTLTIHGTVP